MGNGTEKNVEEVGVADERVEEKAVLGSDRLNKSQVEEAFKEAVETQEHLDERGTIAKSGDGEIGNSTLEEVLAVEKSLAEAVSLESHQETESSKEILTEASDNGVLDITLVGADDVSIEKGLAAEENLWHTNSETDSKNNAIEKLPLNRRQKKQLGNRIEEVEEEEEEPEATSNMSITATLKPSISELDLDRPNIEDYLPSGSSIHQEPHGKLRLRDLLDISPTLTEAAGAIVDDSFTRCFKSNFPEPWNWNVYLFPLWCCGVVIRYLILFPVRVIVLTLGWIIFLSAYIPVHFLLKGHDKWRKKSERFLVELICSFFVASWTGVVKYHGPRPSMRPNQVFVANHTSMIDFIILEQMTAFSVIMQKHVGWVGLLQSTILESVGCIWFNRTESKDREIVARKLREHVQGADNPLLIFPEGTCVNNHYTVMFKKGAFELGCSVCPIAIKYNKIFVDAFWNSRKQSFTKHLLQLMTSWAVVCDVWYLEPQTLRPGETPIEFAERVRGIISARANLKKVPWDGYLKHSRPSPKHRERKQQGFAESVLRRLEEK